MTDLEARTIVGEAAGDEMAEMFPEANHDEMRDAAKRLVAVIITHYLRLRSLDVMPKGLPS